MLIESGTSYFAAQSAEEVIAQIEHRESKQETLSASSGLARKVRKAFSFYFGKQFARDLEYRNGEIIRTGAQGELVAYATNHLRNLVKRVVIDTTAQRLAFDVMAVNVDSKSSQQAKLGEQLLEYYVYEQDLDQKLKRAAEQALAISKGYLFALWDDFAGLDYFPGPNGMIRQGDPAYFTPLMSDVLYDPGLKDWDQCKWAKVTLSFNKYMLAARYPHLKDQIEGYKPDKRLSSILDPHSHLGEDDSDMVPLHYFEHIPMDGLSQGREIIYLDGNIKLVDREYQYGKEMNLFRIVPDEVFDTTEGYTDTFEVMALQEAYNMLKSIQLTNQNSHGVQKIWVQEGENLTATQVSKGLALIKSKVKPEPIQLTATAKEIPENALSILKDMEMLMGQNSASRGNIQESGLTAGVAIALVNALAIQYQSGFQKNWAKISEKVATFTLVNLLGKKAHIKRAAPIVGKFKQGAAMRAFSKDDLSEIRRVKITLMNPLFQTTAGKLQVSEMMMAQGMIKTPQQFIEMLETGRIEPLTKITESELSLINQENEDLLAGKPVIPMVGDAQLLHAQEHLVIIKNTELRRRASMGDPEAKAVLAGATQHIQEHLKLYNSQLPIWAQITGEPPAPPQMPPPPGGMPPEGMEPPPPGGFPPLPGDPESVPPSMVPPAQVPRVPNLNEELQPTGTQAIAI